MLQEVIWAHSARDTTKNGNSLVTKMEFDLALADRTADTVADITSLKTRVTKLENEKCQLRLLVVKLQKQLKLSLGKNTQQ